MNWTGIVLTALLAVSLSKAPYFSQPELSAGLLDWRNAGKFYVYSPSQDPEFKDAKNGVFYIHAGRPESPVIVLIHGFPTSSYDWHQMLPDYIKQNYQVLALDMLGFGFSDKPQGYNYTIAEQADIHVKLLDDLRIREIHILAHDYGNTVAQEILARFGVGAPAKHPKTGADQLVIKSVTFLNGGLFPESHKPVLAQKVLKTPYIGPILSPWMNKFIFTKTITPLFSTLPDEQTIQDMYDTIAFNNGGANTGSLLGYIEERAANRERWVGALQKTRVPLQFINGPADPVSGRHMAERFSELVPAGRVDFLEDHIRHWPNLEVPLDVMRLHADQLKRLEIEELHRRKDRKDGKAFN